MTRRLAVLVTVAAFVATLAGPGFPARAQLSTQDFAAYGTGATLSVNLLRLGNTQAVNVQTAFAGQAVDSTGLGGAIANEMGFTVLPADAALAGRSAYGRGSGVEVGIGVPVGSAENQILLAGLAEAAAPPPVLSPVVKQVGPLSLGGLAYVNLLRSRAQAIYDPSTCVIGRPITYGEGEAAGVQLVGTTNATTGQLDSPVVGTSLPVTSNDPRNANRSRSLSYLRPNGDGTFALVSEVRQTIAPVSLLGGVATLELLGEWALRAIATGKPGGAKVEYAPVGAGPTTQVVRLTLLNAVPITLTLQDLLGPGGLNLSIPPLATIRVGTPARAIGGAGPAQVAADGTAASAAVDVAMVNLLNLGILNLNVADIRLGHMEAAAAVPPGGIVCRIPVSKSATPNPVTVGNDATITIQIPADSGQFARLFGCQLLNVRAQDVHRVVSGNPSFSIVSASNGGVISPDRSTVTWDNLGNYRIGDPPITLTVVVRIPATSGLGVLGDTASVVASLGNCVGGADGQDIVGGTINGLGLTTAIALGNITFVGPEIVIAPSTTLPAGPTLPPTGGSAVPLVAGGALMVAAMFMRRRLLGG